MTRSIRFSTIFYSLFFCLSLVISHTVALKRGIAWASNDNWAMALLPPGSQYTWYWHWERGSVSQLDHKLDYVPCYWGPKFNSLWHQRKREMKSDLPQAILGFNEPDVPSQSNLDPHTAAKLWIKELQPYSDKGVRLGSPQIAWNQDWLANFLKELEKLGGSVDFVAVHWYGSWADTAAFKNYVSSVHRRFRKPVWVTEYGVTTKSGGTNRQVKQFHQEVTKWMAGQSYIERSSNFGYFSVKNPPDGFASAKNAIFNSDGSVRSLGHWYMFSDLLGMRRRRTFGKKSHSHTVQSFNEKHVDQDAALPTEQEHDTNDQDDLDDDEVV